LAQKRLGILVIYLSQGRLEELPFFRRLSTEGRRLGLQIEVFAPNDVDENGCMKAIVYDSKRKKWIRRLTSLPSLIYDRCRYQGSANYQMLQAFRSKYPELTYLGKPLANKWTMHEILTENDTIREHIPPTVRYSGPHDAIRFLKEHKHIYIKPKNGTGGRGILRIEQIGRDLFMIQGRNQQRSILPPQRASTRQLAVKLNALSLNSNFIIQRGIDLILENGRVHDYRLLIQKNGNGEWEVTGCAGRIGPSLSITSNLHGGGSAVSIDHLLYRRFRGNIEWVEQIKNDLNGFAYELAAYLESRFGQLCELGVDIAIDPNGEIWLLEVNPKPSREVFHRIGELETYRKAVIRPLEYALWLMSQNQTNTEAMQQDV
jgi:hypothetical protein